jgi:hypothetical protein
MCQTRKLYRQFSDNISANFCYLSACFVPDCHSGFKICASHQIPPFIIFLFNLSYHILIINQPAKVQDVVKKILGATTYSFDGGQETNTAEIK